MMIITLKKVTHQDNQINVQVEFTAGSHTVIESFTFYGVATAQELVAQVKAAARRLYQAAQTANAFTAYLDKQYSYDYDTDALTEIIP